MVCNQHHCNFVAAFLKLVRDWDSAVVFVVDVVGRCLALVRFDRVYILLSEDGRTLLGLLQ